MDSEQYDTPQAQPPQEPAQRAIHAAGLGVWELDPADLSWLHHSPQLDELLGHARQQTAWDWTAALQHVFNEDRQVLLDAVARAVEAGSDSAEVRVRWADGSVHSVAFRGRVHCDACGRPTRIAGVAIDVTANKATATAARLFEAFEQADASTTREHGDTGLGLAITRRLAELMGSSAGAHARPGGGSSFWSCRRRHARVAFP